MNEKDSIQALERQARNTNRLMDNLCLAWKGRTWEEAHMDYTFEDYRKALEGAGPKLKELILDRAAHDLGIDLMELKELVSSAYPEDVQKIPPDRYQQSDGQGLSNHEQSLWIQYIASKRENQGGNHGANKTKQVFCSPM